MKKSKLFYAIAKWAIAAGREITLEDSDSYNRGNVLGGSLALRDDESHGLTLRVFAPVPGLEDEEDDNGED